MKITSAEFVRGIRGTNPILHDGFPQIAFIGRSNVGKSSIINALANKKNLVKISDRPGKTKEINFFRINNKFYFVDLPGYGYARVGPVEREKLRKLILWYFKFSEAKPLKVVLIIDAVAGFTEFDKEMLGILLKYDHPYLVVVNKIDKLNQKELSAQLAKISSASNEAEVIKCSTKTKNGLADLEKRLL